MFREQEQVQSALGSKDPRQTDAQSIPKTLEGKSTRLGSRRSRAACRLCRFRKVRCDGESGRPCHNCVFENVDCVVPERQSRRRTQIRRSITIPSPSVDAVAKSPQERIEVQETSIEQQMTDDQPRLEMSPSLNQHQPHDEVNLSQDGDCGFDVTSANEHVQPRVALDWYAAATQSLPSPISPDASMGLSTTGLSLVEAEKSSHNLELPSWVKPIPGHLSREDVDYLRRKGAFLVPETDLRDELIKSYVEFVHPCLPMVDLEALQASLQNPKQHKPISLLLFQAIMFAGAAWGDIILVRRSGYWTRMAMRRAFYSKTKLLYDFSYEKDRLVIVQALTILTIWWDGPNEQKDGYYYSSVALSVARSIGLHRDVHSQNLPSSIRRLRRRTWWCCLMRDTITSLGANRAPRAKESDFTVPVLTFDDFEIREPASVATKWAVSRDVASQRQLASICIAMTKLCRIMSLVVELAYDENPIGHTGILYPKEDNSTTSDAITEIQQTSEMDIDKLETCEEELRRWREEVPEGALHQSPAPIVSLPHEQAPYLHRAMLSLLYFMALFSLHRPRVLAASTTRAGAASKDGQSSPQKLMRYAAACTNKIVMELYQVDLMRSLPATGLSCILAISFSHVFDLQSPKDEIRREGFRRLEECKQALRELTDAHLAAEWAIKFLTFAASHVTRSSNLRQRVAVSNEVTESKGEYAQALPSQRILWNNSSQAEPASLVVQDETSALETVNSGTTEIQSWQQLISTIPMEINYRFSCNNTLLPPEDNQNFLAYSDMWLGGIATPFESVNTMNCDGTFDGFV